MKWRNTILHPEFDKNWDRKAPSFANINLLGTCNADCYFCLGKDIDPVFAKQNQMRQHFLEWPRFQQFLDRCRKENVWKVYLTGQNTDALLYRHLAGLIEYMQDAGFLMGLRTNGFLAHKRMREIRSCRANPGFSIHTLKPSRNKKIMGTEFIPDWDTILGEVGHCRVSIVVTRHNEHEIDDLIRYCGLFESVQYVQVRRICTDSRESYLIKDVTAYERVYQRLASKKSQIGEFYTAPVHRIHGKDVCFWRTVKTSIDSINYFTDGTISDEYFVIEGYMRESENYPNLKGIPINAHGMGLEGYWRKAP